MRGGKPLAHKDSYHLDRLLSIYPGHESFSDEDRQQFQLETLLRHFRSFHLPPISQFIMLLVHLCCKRNLRVIMSDIFSVSCDVCTLHHNFLTRSSGKNVDTMKHCFACVSIIKTMCNEMIACSFVS